MGLVSGLIIAIIGPIAIDYLGIAQPKIIYVEGISQLPERINNIQDPEEWRIHLAYKAKFRNKGFKSGFIDKIVVEPTGLADYPEVEVINIDKTPIKWREERVITYEVILKMDWEYVRNKSKSKYEFKLYIYDNTGKQVHWLTSTLHSWWPKDLLE